MAANNKLETGTNVKLFKSRLERERESRQIQERVAANCMCYFEMVKQVARKLSFIDVSILASNFLQVCPIYTHFEDNCCYILYDVSPRSTTIQFHQ